MKSAEALKAAADRLALFVRGLDQRQPEAANVVAEEVERRFDPDGIHRGPENLVRRRELGFDPPGGIGVALLEQRDLLLHLRPDDVGVDADAADTADLEKREE